MDAHASGGHHEHHWEWSYAPALVVLGTFFGVVIAFAAQFHYGNPMLATIFAGIGAPLLLAGIAKWTNEGLTETHLHFGYAVPGLSVFIVSEVFIFLGLFSSYWTLRLSADYDWPPAGTPHFDLNIPIIMTIILVSSSFTMHMGEEKLEHGDTGGFKTWLIVTILLGLLFFGFTAYEYNHLLHAGFGPSTNSYSTAFYSITGFHASHVLIGLISFLFVLFPAMSGKINKTFVTCVSIYWHFVDVVWFFVVSQIYFW